MVPIIALAAALQASPASPAPAPSPAAVSPSEPQAGDWRPIPDDELLVMTLAGDRRVVIRLAAAYAPAHVGNVRALARARWWDATSVYRVQDDWVTQWGGAPSDAEEKPLPPGIVARPAAEFDLAGAFAPAQRLPVHDAYSGAGGITADGWAIATGTPAAGVSDATGRPAWLAHCYGTVGVARDALPDTGSGGELFVAIGGSARRLDRNYTIVGRVIDGMAYLSGLPRSDAPMGFYADPAARTVIVRVRLASDLPAGERPRYEYRRADNPRFAAMIAAKASPAPPTVGLGGVDVCDVPLATRRAP